MDIRPLDPRLSATPQISIEDVASAAAEGYKSIVCNRPDGEAPDQPDHGQIQAAAEAAGLAFRYIPVIPGQAGPGEVAAMAEALANLPTPILGYCRTGTRTTFMWALAQAGERPADELIEAGARAGYDLSGLRPRLEG